MKAESVVSSAPYPSSFILPPSSFLSVSPKKLSNVWVLSLAQSLVCAAKNDFSFAHHHHFSVDETKPFTFPFENDLALFVDDRVFRTQVIEVVHFVGHKYRR